MSLTKTLMIFRYTMRGLRWTELKITKKVTY